MNYSLCLDGMGVGVQECCVNIRWNMKDKALSGSYRITVIARIGEPVDRTKRFNGREFAGDLDQRLDAKWVEESDT